MDIAANHLQVQCSHRPRDRRVRLAGVFSLVVVLATLSDIAVTPTELAHAARKRSLLSLRSVSTGVVQTRRFTVPSRWTIQYNFDCTKTTGISRHFHNREQITLVSVRPHAQPQTSTFGNGTARVGRGAIHFTRKSGTYYLRVRINCPPWRLSVHVP